MPVGQKSVKGKKSGIKVMEPGQVLFNENDYADSLFIIQKGQLRLYRPKGRGYDAPPSGRDKPCRAERRIQSSE